MNKYIKIPSVYWTGAGDWTTAVRSALEPFHLVTGDQVFVDSLLTPFEELIFVWQIFKDTGVFPRLRSLATNGVVDLDLMSRYAFEERPAEMRRNPNPLIVGFQSFQQVAYARTVVQTTEAPLLVPVFYPTTPEREDAELKGMIRSLSKVAALLQKVVITVEGSLFPAVASVAAWQYARNAHVLWVDRRDMQTLRVFDLYTM